MSTPSAEDLRILINEATGEVRRRKPATSEQQVYQSHALAALSAMHLLVQRLGKVLSSAQLEAAASAVEPLTMGYIEDDYSTRRVAVFVGRAIIDLRSLNHGTDLDFVDIELALEDLKRRGVDLSAIDAYAERLEARRAGSNRFSAGAEAAADAEEVTANNFRKAAYVSMTVIVIAAAAEYVIGRNYESDGGLAFLLSALAHAVVFLPALLLIGYLAREAAQHRHVSRELRYKAIQMRSVVEFAQGLPDEQPSGFLESLGTTIFAAPFNQPGKATHADLPGAQIDSHLAHLSDLLRAAAPGSR